MNFSRIWLLLWIQNVVVFLPGFWWCTLNPHIRFNGIKSRIYILVKKQFYEILGNFWEYSHRESSHFLDIL
ncbi:hypothetical protein AUJ66_02775 [Candidatus Desantisbacteria bacterium CG1_02_38_46]|uniref:Uncharacterized protein n=3 Tax=unclassified Candidatus Desantisiibacteriota TaxID=3106372 RepID=A0A2H9P9Z7_9BACT|nr:MAG: hypothetical protein AUJ66_02775 [Candidatus Desantisbacteria bacterium CG1_02_38_46]PIU50961.1 MAG: hypothetical protein COS91_06955 [Candidatus Desantisbacteria bacterium CG07_land_8_20_14_0_80_39_15]PIZ15108.1 MAG: hypothetical protein COY51_06180 [Candidatus Desantisbacteria bacterium CG_4_10_14_0_8_um_filter_39_17]